MILTENVQQISNELLAEIEQNQRPVRNKNVYWKKT